jgi:hypothetical protein
MNQRARHAIMALALAPTFSAAALAEGPGQYAVSGTTTKDKSEYQGTATLTRTGHMTWRIVEDIGGDHFEGFGVGDGKVIAVTFADASTAVALYTANADGSYTAVWAEEDDTEVNTETLKPQ